MTVGFGLGCQHIMPPFPKLHVHIAPPPTSLPFLECGFIISSPSTRSKDHGVKSPIRIAQPTTMVCMPCGWTLSRGIGGWSLLRSPVVIKCTVGCQTDPLVMNGPTKRSKGPPCQHNLIRLPATVVRELSSLQPNMQHSEDQQGGPHQHHADMPWCNSIALDRLLYKYRRGQELIYAAMPINGTLAKTSPHLVPAHQRSSMARPDSRSTKKSMPEVWWRGPGTEAKIHTYTGNAMNTYTGPSYAPASIYILRLRSKDQDTRATVYLHEGSGTSWAFPQLPSDSRVRTLGVGMTSVTLSWVPSAPLKRLHTQRSYDYCVLVNRKHNYRNLCAAQEGIRKEREKDKKREKDKQRKVTVWPILKDWWWQQWDADTELQSPAALRDDYGHLQCVCKGTESVCTVSELVPDTQYYFDVFLIDRLNGTSAAYTGTFAQTHEEARPAITPLREGELRWVTFQDGGSTSGEFFSFRPRGWQQSGLLTLQSCESSEKINITVSSKGKELSSQAVGENLAQIWLQGSPSYLIHLEKEGTAAPRQAAPGVLKASVKMQVSSTYHRQGIPSLPSTLQIKSFNRLRSCASVTLAWMGTEERSLYCVYRQRLGKGGGKKGGTAPCLGPESRSDTEKVLCKYFQELNPRRAVTTAVIGGLEPGVAYIFDVYLMRRWGIPIKYSSKTVRTRKEC